ncbi:MAG TPA: iron-hydroxamate ABC transporter substrate-binding protein [Vibrio sp.]|nr:iron-hydroxamate ABC transporter substrate-binding protein [Vibrio sp.]
MTRTVHLFVTVLTLLFSSSLMANSFRTTIGVDAWFANSKIDDQRYDDDIAPNLFISVEHDLAYLPYMSLRYSSVDGDYAGFDKYDFSFYYRILERDTMLFDAGVTFTQYTNSYYRTIQSPEQKYDFDELTFNWYAYAELAIPNSQFDIIGQFDFGNSKEIKRADVLAGVQYKVNDDVAIRVGYRVVDLELDHLATLTPEVTESLIFVNGFFVGAEYRF